MQTSSMTAAASVSLSTEKSAQRTARRVTIAIGSFSLLLASCIMVLFIYRPLYMFGLGICTYALYHYVTQPRSFMHRTRNAESKFWTFLGVGLSISLFLVPDSPWRFSNPFVGLLVTVLSSYMVYYIDSHGRMSTLNSKFRFSRHESIPTLLENDIDFDHESTQEKLELIKSLTDLLEDRIIHNLNTLSSYTQLVNTETQIIKEILDTNKKDLNYIVQHVNMKILLYKVHNRERPRAWSQLSEQAIRYKLPWKSVFGKEVLNGGNKNGRSRSKLLDALSRIRVRDLTVSSKVVILDSIQFLRLTIDDDIAPEAEEAIIRIVMSTEGEALSLLKTLMDSKGSVFSMHYLVFEDIKSEDNRQLILGHINRQASRLQAHFVMGNSISKKLQKRPWRKIVSDVDDTFISSGGRYPAGIDTAYPNHVVYPGAISFYREMDLGCHPSMQDLEGDWPKDELGNLAFLSARPHIYKDVIERSVFTKFQMMLEFKNLHSMPCLLPGDVSSGQAYILRGDLMPMANKKVQNFNEYFKIYPEFRHVFIGDNGQADVKAAEMMCERFPDAIEAVYIHKVQHLSHTFGFVQGESYEKWERLGIYFYETFVEAATHAATKRNLISPKGLHRICHAAVEDFIMIDWKHEISREEPRLKLNSHLVHANEIITGAGLDPVPLIPANQKYIIGSVVVTPLGRGHVIGFDEINNVYEIVLFDPAAALLLEDEETRRFRSNTMATDFSQTSAGTSRLSVTDEHSLPGTVITAPTSGPASNETDALFPGRIYLHYYEISSKKRSLFRKSKLKMAIHSGDAAEKQAMKFQVGDTLPTIFGPAVVISVRPIDKMYELEQKELGIKMYMHQSAFVKNEDNKRRSSSYESFRSWFNRFSLPNSTPMQPVGEPPKEGDKPLRQCTPGTKFNLRYGPCTVMSTFTRDGEEYVVLKADNWNAILFMWKASLLSGEDSPEEFSSVVPSMRDLFRSLGNRFSSSTTVPQAVKSNATLSENSAPIVKPEPKIYPSIPMTKSASLDADGKTKPFIAHSDSNLLTRVMRTLGASPNLGENLVSSADSPDEESEDVAASTDVVLTLYGQGRILAKQHDKFIIDLDWGTLHCSDASIKKDLNNSENILLQSTPPSWRANRALQLGDSILTRYGKGKVIEFHPNCRLAISLDWNQASQHKGIIPKTKSCPMLYLTNSSDITTLINDNKKTADS